MNHGFIFLIVKNIYFLKFKIFNLNNFLLKKITFYYFHLQQETFIIK